jgi:hypothetical protein
MALENNEPQDLVTKGRTERSKEELWICTSAECDNDGQTNDDEMAGRQAGKRHTGSGWKTPLERQDHRRDTTMALQAAGWRVGGWNTE